MVDVLRGHFSVVIQKKEFPHMSCMDAKHNLVQIIESISWMGLS